MVIVFVVTSALDSFGPITKIDPNNVEATHKYPIPFLNFFLLLAIFIIFPFPFAQDIKRDESFRL